MKIFTSFKGIVMILIAFLCFTKTGIAQTTLAPGDVALLGLDATDPDEFSIIFLKNITAGTKIVITDNGFLTSTTGRTGEGFLTYTAPSSLSAGSIIDWKYGISNGSAWTADVGSGNTPTNFLCFSTDQIFIFQGTSSILDVVS